jgi:ketosteroid isomerase-like protein
MRLASIAVVLSSAALVGCQPSHQLTPQQENVQRQILGDRMNEWVQAVNNNQVDAAMAMYTTDESLTLVFTDGRRGFGEEGARALADFLSGLNFINLVPQNPNFDLLDAGTAVVTFRFSVDAILGDTSRDPFAGQGTLVWVKDQADNLWKIHTQHLSRNPM